MLTQCEMVKSSEWSSGIAITVNLILVEWNILLILHPPCFWLISPGLIAPCAVGPGDVCILPGTTIYNDLCNRIEVFQAATNNRRVIISTLYRGDFPRWSIRKPTILEGQRHNDTGTRKILAQDGPADLRWSAEGQRYWKANDTTILVPINVLQRYRYSSMSSSRWICHSESQRYRKADVTTILVLINVCLRMDLPFVRSLLHQQSMTDYDTGTHVWLRMDLPFIRSLLHQTLMTDYKGIDSSTMTSFVRSLLHQKLMTDTKALTHSTMTSFVRSLLTRNWWLITKALTITSLTWGLGRTNLDGTSLMPMLPIIWCYQCLVQKWPLPFSLKATSALGIDGCTHASTLSYEAILCTSGYEAHSHDEELVWAHINLFLWHAGAESPFWW